tara:strand:+ start:120 stop:575 length:456 start_codon:yes stop_codon:yes gene_type:complete
MFILRVKRVDTTVGILLAGPFFRRRSQLIRGNDVARGPNQTNSAESKDTKALKDDKWQLLTGVTNAAAEKISLYVDRATIDENFFQATQELMQFGLSECIIQMNIRKKLFGGLVGDVRIYNCALSVREIKSLYDFESTPPGATGDRPSRKG